MSSESVQPSAQRRAVCTAAPSNLRDFNNNYYKLQRSSKFTFLVPAVLNLVQILSSLSRHVWASTPSTRSWFLLSTISVCKTTDKFKRNICFVSVEFSCHNTVLVIRWGSRTKTTRRGKHQGLSENTWFWATRWRLEIAGYKNVAMQNWTAAAGFAALLFWMLSYCKLLNVKWIQNEVLDQSSEAEASLDFRKAGCVLSALK